MITQEGVKYEEYEDGYTIVGYTKEVPQNLEIPEFVNSRPVLKVSEFAFDFQYNLRNLTLPKSLKIIEFGGFNFGGITGTVEIPDSVEVIEGGAFSSNRAISYRIGKGLKSLGDGAFGDNPTLESIIVSNENPYFCSINNALYDKSMTTLYCIPPQLKNFTFPPTVVLLKPRSIQINNIDTLLIPATVSYIEHSSVFRVPQLKNIHFFGNLASLDKNFIFQDIKTVERIFYHGT